MKHYKASAFFSIFAFIFLASSHHAQADQQWHYQASAQVSQPGMVETVLPAGVFFGTDSAVTKSRDHMRVEQTHELKYYHAMKIPTDKRSLAVTIQITEIPLLYGHSEGCRLSSEQ